MAQINSGTQEKPTMLPKLLPLCLAAICLSAGPTLAQSAPAAPRTIVLQHVVPAELLKSLHWDNAKDLPAGVLQITALPTTNALSIVATPDGFAQVKEIVALADIAPRQVKMEFALAALTDAQLKAFGIRFDLIPVPGIKGLPPKTIKYASGKKVTAFLRTLQARKMCPPASALTTTTNTDAKLLLSRYPLLPNVRGVVLEATPRLGEDGAITLALSPLVVWHVPGKANPDGTPQLATEGLRGDRTVRNGETMVYVNLFAGSAGPNKRLLLFVTPTVLPQK